MCVKANFTDATFSSSSSLLFFLPLTRRNHFIGCIFVADDISFFHSFFPFSSVNSTDTVMIFASFHVFFIDQRWNSSHIWYLAGYFVSFLVTCRVITFFHVFTLLFGHLKCPRFGGEKERESKLLNVSERIVSYTNRGTQVAKVHMKRETWRGEERSEVKETSSSFAVQVKINLNDSFDQVTHTSRF